MAERFVDIEKAGGSIPPRRTENDSSSQIQLFIPLKVELEIFLSCRRAGKRCVHVLANNRKPPEKESCDRGRKRHAEEPEDPILMIS